MNGYAFGNGPKVCVRILGFGAAWFVLWSSLADLARYFENR